MAKFHVESMPLEHLSRQHDSVVLENRRCGVFPGSFNPLTIAHLEIAERARADHDLDFVDLVVSIVALDKPAPPGPPLADRISLIESDLEEIPWLFVKTTDDKLIVDISAGYDVVIMGSDKWAQVNDVSYYGSESERDAAIARLPKVLVADRDGFDTPDEALRLETDERVRGVSSTAARNGDRAMMAPHAAANWSDDADD